MTKTQKIIAFSIPILIGGYLIYRQFRGTKTYQEDCCKQNPPCPGCSTPPPPPPTPPTPTTTYKKYIVNTLSTPLNVRSSPSTSSSIIGKLAKGTEIFARASSTTGWFEYSANGTSLTGYVSADYLKLK